MLDVSGWYTLGVLTLMFIALVREYLSADFVVFGALVALWLGGIIETEEALSGFHNEMVVTIGFLFIVSAAMRETGALNYVTQQVLGSNSDRKSVMVRLLFPTSFLSAFMNNTPLVAMFTPLVRDWAVRHDRAPSKFLIPLSYAAILGGTCTLIGTSTNLVVSGLLSDLGYAPFGMFELSPVGVPATVAGLCFIFLFGKKLLPVRQTPEMLAGKTGREYSVVLEVASDCPLIGKTIEDAGLRQLSGLFLAEIERGDRRLVPVRPTMRLQQSDRLVLFGVVETVVELRKTQGLIPVSDTGEAEQDDGLRDRNLFEVVVSANSPLIGKTLKGAGFRRRYEAVVIAIHRGGQRLNQKLGEVVLRPGDVLMVEAEPGFRRAWANAADFYLVSAVEQSDRPRYALANFALLILITMVVLVSTEWMSIAKASALAAVLLIWFRCVRPSEARRSIDLSVLLIIACAFGISAAVTNSGLADLIAGNVVHGVGEMRPWVSLAVIYIVTAITTEVLSNAAAAALIVPIAVSTAEQLGRDPRPYAIAVAIAASLSFVTPLGYQTNLLVYGPGGYRFWDFARLGIPMAILCFVVAMSIIPSVWGWGV